MLDIKFIREKTSCVKKAIKARNMTVNIDEILGIDDERRLLLGNVEALKQKRNTSSIGTSVQGYCAKHNRHFICSGKVL